jgi:hypothetical protein
MGSGSSILSTRPFGGFFFEGSMAVSGLAPFVKVLDSNGAPIVGAVLKVYQAGTTTYLAIYSDASLTIPLSNPLSGASASNASGDFPRFYLAQGTYKLRAETSTGTLIWEWDNIDTGLSAGVGALPISAGGTGAVTAAAARANLGVPSTSEMSDLAASIATLSSSVQNIVSSPQGRLTLTTGTPVLATGVSAAAAVYYTQFIGNIVPVYNGSQFSTRAFTSDLALTLNANHVANAIYDVFVYWDGTNLQIGTGVAWNTATAGSGSRGAGAGTTELVRVNGLWVNKFDIAYRNGATTGTITANQGTYVGSIAMDGTNGQVSCLTAYGQSRKWGVWNAYNRKKIILQAGDATASWNYTTGTVRPSNNSSANSLTVFTGLPEEEFDITFLQMVQGGSATGASQVLAGWSTGIGWNSTTAFSGMRASPQVRVDGSSVDILNQVVSLANYIAAPTIGINTATCLEITTPINNASVLYFGSSANMLLKAAWEG